MNEEKCNWCLKTQIEEKYHDNEWGKQVHDDKKLFEMLILECMQAGLSWLTILKKRENYQKAFDDFDYTKIKNYDNAKVEELILNPGIIRNRLKINAIIKNAKAFIEIQKEFGSFDKYIRSFVNYKPIINDINQMGQIPANTKLSDKISKDLKKRGFSFVGTTIIYAFMQSIGIVNDHLNNCPYK